MDRHRVRVPFVVIHVFLWNVKTVANRVFRYSRRTFGDVSTITHVPTVFPRAIVTLTRRVYARKNIILGVITQEFWPRSNRVRKNRRSTSSPNFRAAQTFERLVSFAFIFSNIFQFILILNKTLERMRLR